MRKIIATMWTSLDGFVAGPNDEMDWVRLDEQMMAYEQTLVDEADILMLGRITFGDFAGHWPLLANEPKTELGDSSSVDELQHAYARRIDAMRKVVVSTSGEVADWRNSDILPTITRKVVDQLKREPGRDIVIYGSVSVINALSALNLVDEFHLLLHPIVLRRGRALFDHPLKLELKSAELFKSGVILAKYEAREREAR